MNRLLLCTDLDGTTLPNGDDIESEHARQKFCRLAAHPQVTLAYVTGRHQELVEQAIAEYHIPKADYVIADVGSTIYQVTDTGWKRDEEWENNISRDWNGKTTKELHSLLKDLDLQSQEPSKQNKFKLSYYVSLDVDHENIISLAEEKLNQNSISCNLVWSVDPQAKIGLLDILPAGAGKRQAIEFLMRELGFNYSNTIFAGDSGNDICVLGSSILSVLVANAEDNVREAAISEAKAGNRLHALYLAKGNYLGMNGNYAAGILEGVTHFMPEAERWFTGEK